MRRSRTNEQTNITNITNTTNNTNWQVDSFLQPRCYDSRRPLSCILFEFHLSTDDIRRHHQPTQLRRLCNDFELCDIQFIHLRYHHLRVMNEWFFSPSFLSLSLLTPFPLSLVLPTRTSLEQLWSRMVSPTRWRSKGNDRVTLCFSFVFPPFNKETLSLSHSRNTVYGFSTSLYQFACVSSCTWMNFYENTIYGNQGPSFVQGQLWNLGAVWIQYLL